MEITGFNQKHDAHMLQLLKEATGGQNLDSARFQLLLLGSAGREEQLRFADQDHMMICSEGAEAEAAAVGETFSSLLEASGYPRCEGGVMAGNDMWCRTEASMEKQLRRWIEKRDWESLRYILIFYDARPLHGPGDTTVRLKQLTSSLIQEYGLEAAMFQNTRFRLKRRNVFGQILTDQKGDINMKKDLLFPYANAARAAAAAEGITVAATKLRLEQLSFRHPHLKPVSSSFQKLLEFRREKSASAASYEDVHLLRVDELTKAEMKQVKHWMKEGKKVTNDLRSVYSRERADQR
ncbi:DUF294 domain-containing protein [Alkalicoccus chagannorensis]